MHILLRVFFVKKTNISIWFWIEWKKVETVFEQIVIELKLKYLFELALLVKIPSKPHVYSDNFQARKKDVLGKI